MKIDPNEHLVRAGDVFLPSLKDDVAHIARLDAVPHHSDQSGPSTVLAMCGVGAIKGNLVKVPDRGPDMSEAASEILEKIRAEPEYYRRALERAVGALGHRDAFGDLLQLVDDLEGRSGVAVCQRCSEVAER